MKLKNILLNIAKVVLHIVGFPLLAAIVLIINRKVIQDGAMYGVSVFVSLIIVALMAAIYYAAYFLVRTKKKRSIRNQTIIVVIVAVCCLTGFWMLIDGVAADPLEGATSSTIRWEDLVEDWENRADVNRQLLDDYVELNFKLGRLKSLKGETVEDYIKQGPNGNEELAALLQSDFEDIDGDGYASFRGPSVDYAQSDRMTIPVLLHLFLDDRSSVQGVNSSYEKALTLAVPYYYNPAITKALDAKAAEDTELMDEDEKAAYYAAMPLKEETQYVLRVYHGYDDADDDMGGDTVKAFIVTDAELNKLGSYSIFNEIKLTEGTYHAIHRESSIDDEGKAYFQTVDEKTFASKEEAIYYLRSTYDCEDDYFVLNYRLATVSWHVLDMLGEGMNMDMSGLFSQQLMNTTVGLEGMFSLGTVGDILNSDLLPDAFAVVADMINEPELLGSPLYIALNTQTGELSLEPSNAHRGVLGYMQMGWLNANGLLFIIASFFSLHTIFYIYGPVMAIITLLLGCIREAQRKDKEAKEEIEQKAESAETTQEEAPVAQEDTSVDLDAPVTSETLDGSEPEILGDSDSLRDVDI